MVSKLIYCLICLDVFRETKYTEGVEINELNGWLSFLAIDDVDEAERLLDDYPWLEEVYCDVAQNLSKPEEVLNMFSEALKIMDRNTALYMIEQQQEEFKARLAEKDAEIAEREKLHVAEMAKKDNALAKQIAQAEHYKELLKQAGISVE